jgi:pseudouridine-5'-phosphate glycosidase
MQWMVSKVIQTEIIGNNKTFIDVVINNSIMNALTEAERAGIKGKEVTPFILAAISKITAGKSLLTSKDLNH